MLCSPYGSSHVSPKKTIIVLSDFINNSFLFFLIVFFNVYLFLRQRAHERGRVRERGRQNLKQAPDSELSAQSPTRGWNSQTARSWPEPKSVAQPTEPPRHPMCTLNLTKMFLFLYSFLKCLFLRERERETEHEWGRGRDRQRQNLKQAPDSELSAQSLTQGSNSQTTSHHTISNKRLWFSLS